MGCCKSVGSSDPFLEVFSRLPHLCWCAPQSTEEIAIRGLNHAPTKDSKTTISLALGYDPPSVIGFDSSVVMPTEVGSLPEWQMLIVASAEKVGWIAPRSPSQVAHQHRNLHHHRRCRSRVIYFNLYLSWGGGVGSLGGSLVWSHLWEFLTCLFLSTGPEIRPFLYLLWLVSGWHRKVKKYSTGATCKKNLDRRIVLQQGSSDAQVRMCKQRSKILSLWDGLLIWILGAWVFIEKTVVQLFW